MQKTKRILAGILTAALMFVLLPTDVFSAVGGVFTADGIKYLVLSEDETTGAVGVIANSYSGDIVIPETVENDGITYSVTSIEYMAFHNCSGLISIDIPDSVTSIGNDAFSFCSGLTSITIPDNVTSIGNYAFDNCINLTSITIPDNVTSIGLSAFGGCSELESISIPDSVTFIGNSAFEGCSSFESIVIPDSMTSIENYLFKDCVSLESVIIPDSVTSIGTAAFGGCSELESISIPDSVTSIGNYAFFYCGSLESISIPEGVTSISYCAFYACSSLESISIPDSVTSIEGSAFEGCSSLASINIPDAVTSVGDNAFYNCEGLESINIPTGVTSIGSNAFYGCSGLESISIPGNVTSIGDYAFKDCSSLADAYFGGAAPEAGIEVFDGTASGFTIYYASGASGWTNLWNGYQAVAVYIPVRQTGVPATTPENVDVNTAYTLDLETIFEDESNAPLTYRVSVNGAADSAAVVNYSYTPASVGITKLVFKANNRAADSIDTYTVTLTARRPFTVDEINYNALSENGATGTAEVISNNYSGNFTIPEEVVNGGITYTVTAIGNSAFNGCDSLTSISIPEGVTSIGDEAFYNCNSLTSISIPESVTSIGDQAFYFCSSLTSISIPQGVISIGDGAFHGCSSLTGINLPDSVTSIGDGMFNGCSSLTNISLPDSLTFIGNYVFVGCSDLTSISIPNGVTSIGYSAFDGCSSLTNISLPDSVTFIGNGAFVSCSSLSSIRIPTGMTSIESNTFSGCSGLTSISIPGSVTFIGGGAFSNCSSLTSINLPGNVTYIGDETFYSCTSLTSIRIPASVYYIGGGAFANCSSLAYAYFVGDAPSAGMGVFDGAASEFAIYYTSGALEWTNPWNGYPTAVEHIPARKAGVVATSLANVTVNTAYTLNLTTIFGDADGDPLTYKVSANGGASVIAAASYVYTPTVTGTTTLVFGANDGLADSTDTYTVTLTARTAVPPTHDGDGTGGVTPTVTPTPEAPKTEITIVGNTATATTTTTATADNSGKATAAVTQTQVSDAIGKAVEEAQKQGNGTAAVVEIKVEAPADAKIVETGIPKEAVSLAADGKIQALRVSTPVASITFDDKALSTIAAEAEEAVNITASKVEASSLLPKTRQIVGDRPVFNFSVTSGNRTISQFGGNVSVSVPYTPKPGEDTNAIVIYYINAAGDPELVSDCVYDPATGTVSFSTDHFSKYAVGYNKVSFKDVSADAWYGKAVGFIAARDIPTGIEDGMYNPAAKLTRGEFLVMLMRAYGIAPDENPKDNFTDAGNTYYTNYLAAAKRLSISVGIGNNMFAPGKGITRQEMFTLLYNTLKAINRLPQGSSGKPISAFSDDEEIASWAKKAMTLLVETGTISGSNGKLFPKSTATRAEMAQVLYKLLSK